MEGANGARRRRRCRPRLWARSHGITAVELTIEKLFGCRIVKNFSRQTVNAIGKKTDFVSGVVGDARTLGDKSPQHTVMTLVSAFLAGRIWMGKVHPQLAVLDERAFAIAIALYALS